MCKDRMKTIKGEIKVKKLSIVLTIALVVAFAVPAMAATSVDFSGNLEMENAYNDPGVAKSYGDLDLYLNADIAEGVTAFTELDYEINFENGSKNSSTDTKKGEIDQMWINVEDAFGPLALRVGRMNEAAAGNILYDIEGGANEFVRFAYDADNISAKLGHNAEGDDSQKLLFAEGKVEDLGLVDAVTLNYIDYNAANEGFTVKVDKNHDFGNASILFGDVDTPSDSASVMDLTFASDVLFPGVNVSLEYATAEAGFVNKDLQDDSVFADANGVLNEDVTVIKPGVSFDVTDKLGVEFSYAMFEGDDSGDTHDYLDLVVDYDLAENTYASLEYEDNAYDGTGDTDNSVITTTLGVNF